MYGINPTDEYQEETPGAATPGETSWDEQLRRLRDFDSPANVVGQVRGNDNVTADEPDNTRG